VSGGGDHIGVGSAVRPDTAATAGGQRCTAGEDEAPAADFLIVPGPRRGRVTAAPGRAAAATGRVTLAPGRAAPATGRVRPVPGAPQVPSARSGVAGELSGAPAPGLDDPEFRDYVRTRRQALLRTAYLLTGNLADAEDLVQSALAKTYLAWDRIEDRTALDGYVRRAIVNTHISWWRRRRVEEFPMDEVPDRAVVDHTGGSDMEETLRRAIDRLPQRMRAAIMLRYFEDLTEAEVAEVLGVALGTVKSTVARAMAKLRVDTELQPD